MRLFCKKYRMFKEMICVKVQMGLKINGISLVIRLLAKDGFRINIMDNDYLA